MNNCENCYHFHMCDLQYRLEENSECKHFKDESLIVELPCKVGDTVYIKGEPAAIDSIHIDKTITYRVRFLCYGRDCSTCPFYEKHDCKAPDKITTDDIGVTVFLTKEEAEKKLKENDNGKV